MLDDIYGTQNGTESGTDTKKKDLENDLSPCFNYGGGAGNRTPDTTDMSSLQINPVF